MNRPLLAIAGDTSLAGPLFAADLETHGPASLFADDLRAALAGARVRHLNLECCVTTATEARDGVVIPLLAHPRQLEALWTIGIDHVSIANNHALDAGPAGLAETCAALTERGIAYSGLAGQGAICVERDGTRVAFVSALLLDSADAEPGASQHLRCIVRQSIDADQAALCAVIAGADADLVVASLHYVGDFLPDWSVPAEWQAVARAALAAGADVVQLHGAHHVLGLERTPDGLFIHGGGGLLDDFGSNFAALNAFRAASPGTIPDDFPLPPSGRAPMTLAHPEFRNDLACVTLIGPADLVRVVPTRINDCRAGLSDRPSDRTWLANRLMRLSPGLHLEADADGFVAAWSPGGGAVDFTAVDAGPAPQLAVRYLDSISTLQQIADYKARAMAQLELRAGERVLEIGCGAGGDLVTLAQAVGPTGQVVGVDKSEVMAAEAARRLDPALPISVRAASAERLPFEDETFDAVRIDRVLMHVDDPEAVLREVYRVLRPGGRWVATEPDWDTLTISAANRRATRAVVHASTDLFRQGLIGRELPGLANVCGFVEIDIGLQSVVLPSFDLANQFWELAGSADRAVEEGTLTREDADAWLADLRQRDSAGTFLCTLTGFGVRGRRPAG